MVFPVQSYPALAAYLDLDLARQLAQEGTLPAPTRAALAAELRRTLAASAAYIPSRLVHRHLAQPQPGRVGGAFWQGSLLFADLSGFTALSERLSVLGKQGAEEVSAVVNQLFAGLIAEVTTYHGMLLKFGGDALTAFFDADGLGPLHAAAAAGAALAMQQHMADFAAVETRAGTFRLGLRVGVHSGRVFAAEVGDETHIELVVTGPEVNQVALAQEIAAPGEVVISDQTATLLTDVGLVPRHAGFQQILSLHPITLPSPLPDPITLDGPDDIATLELLASQVAALRPYLVRNLPRRFLEAAVTGTGEFRPVSVLFANFHDISALITGLDDDAATAATVLNAYFRRAQAVVHRYDGIVNKVDMYTHGDKLMALFGAPAAHEDDPLRAVRCALELEPALEEANEEISALGLEIDSALPNLQSPIPNLYQRIGINTGTVFAGRVGGSQRYEYTVMGPAVNLAARLMAVAEDGAVLLSPATRDAVAHLIAVENQAPIRLKGFAEAVIPARALHAFETERVSRADTNISLPRPPLIGRDEELNQLITAAGVALRGAGRTLAIVGEAGTGKSRLTEELIQRLVMASVSPDIAEGVPSFMIYGGDCQSYEQRTSYAAIRSPLRLLLNLHLHRNDQRIAGEKTGTRPLQATTAEALIYAKVDQLAPDLARFTPLLSDVLGIDISETTLTKALTPQQRHDRAQELVVALLRGAAARDPLLLLIEDIHWADAASLELLARLATSIATTMDSDQGGTPLLLLLNYRPEPPIAQPWRDLPTTTRITLRDLSPESSANLLAALLSGPAPPAILPLLDRTQGNPFFIEELVHALVASGMLAQSAAGTWQLTRPLEQIAIPNSIEGLLIARLDRLDEPRHELVQIASVIGRRFWSALVGSVYSTPAKMSEGLSRLVSSEIIVPEQQESIDELLASLLQTYLFRHALLRDVAYEGILYARRRELHRLIAQQIETMYANTVLVTDEYLTLLAWHYLCAEEWRSAFYYNLAAGVQAKQRFANRDALALLNTALEIAPRLSVSEEPLMLVIKVAEVHEHRGDLYVLLGEYEQAQASYEEALALIKVLRLDPGQWRGDPAEIPALNAQLATQRVRLHRLIAGVHERRSDYDAAFDWLEQGMAQTTSEARAELSRCYLLGAGIYYRRSEYARAMEWARMGLSVAERQESIAGQAHALLLMGNLWQDQGEFTASIQAFQQARTLFEQINDVTQLSDVLNNLGNSYGQAGRWGETVQCFERSLQISESIGDVQATARTSNNLAVVLVGRGELQRAAELYEYSGAQFGRIGSVLGVAVTDYNRGEVLLLQGQPEAALPLFEESIATFERIKARNFLPEVLRLAAEASLALEEKRQAGTYAEQSLKIANEIGMAVEEAVARRVLGQIALTTQDFVMAQDYLEQSRTTLEQLDNRYELGKVVYWQARLFLADGSIEKARQSLQQAEQIFRDLDAQRDLALVQTLAREARL